jgi:hypothetical protein
MDKAAALAKLREAFPQNQVSLLPKPTANKATMDALPKAKCAECGGWHATSKIVHLSYVGHAALTDRLLDADPEWSWEPVAFGADGLPAFDKTGGLWIRLTVAGVSRLGYGNAEPSNYKEVGAREKEVIGDALRNAAMRFGAALELWHKGDLHAHLGAEDDPKKDDQKKDDTKKPGAPIVPAKEAGAAAATVISEDRRHELKELAMYLSDCHNIGKDTDAIRLWYAGDTFSDNEERIYVWNLLGHESKLRSVIKANKPERTPA